MASRIRLAGSQQATHTGGEVENDLDVVHQHEDHMLSRTDDQFNVLVVEDVPELREFLRLILKDTAASPAFAEDVECARTLFHALQPEMVLLDIYLPGAANGLEFCRELKSEFGVGCPVVIMLTSELDLAVMFEARGYGADGYLVKPFSPLQILGLVDTFEAWRVRSKGAFPALWPSSVGSCFP